MFRILSQVFFIPRHLKCILKGWLFVCLLNFDLFTYFLSYLITPWRIILLEKLTGLQLDKKFPAFYGTRRFSTAFTSSLHLSLSRGSWIQSIPPHSTSWRSISILFSKLRLGLPSGLNPSGCPTIRATCPAHLILLDFITRTMLGKDYRLLSLSLCSFLHSPATSSLLGPNTLLNTLFSHTLSLLSSHNVSDQVSHLYRTTGNIIVLYISWSLTFQRCRNILVAGNLKMIDDQEGVRIVARWLITQDRDWYQQEVENIVPR